MPEGATSHDVAVEEQAGYWELVRWNTNFRRLWTGSIISLLGDWFNTIALYTLVVQLTGSPLALGAVFVFKLLPWAIVSPLAGLVADRYNRRRLMIGADLVRAVVVLGFLLINEPSEVYLLYGLIVLQVVSGAVFIPAKNASIPNITTPRELLTANALMSATWSAMLAIGAALGGFAAEVFGVRAVFVIDSATYLVSAFFIYRTTIPQHTEAGEGSLLRTAFGELVDGWKHLRARPRIGRIAFSKAAWAVAGGALVYMITLLGDEVAPQAMAAGIGVLFMARGIGTGIGPILARRLFKDRQHWPAVLGGCIVFCGLGYVLVGYAPWTPGAAASLLLLIVLIVAAHAASGANWVLSTVMLQKRTGDRYRGRVFGTEWLLVMAAESTSIIVASLLLETEMLDLRLSFRVFGLVQIACGVLWLLIVVPKERRADQAESVEELKRG